MLLGILVESADLLVVVEKLMVQWVLRLCYSFSLETLEMLGYLSLLFFLIRDVR